MQPFVFRQQKIPEPERRRRIVEAQMFQAEILLLRDVPAQRPAVIRFAQAVAMQLGVAVIPLVQAELARGGVHFSISTKA